MKVWFVADETKDLGTVAGSEFCGKEESKMLGANYSLEDRKALIGKRGSSGSYGIGISDSLPIAIASPSSLPATSLLSFSHLLSFPSNMSVHPVAITGFTSDTTNYDSARPDHQPQAVSHLLSRLSIPHRGTVVEIGSGTGKFTSHLLSRPENWTIICVEPSDVLPLARRGVT
jgi:hypothetical protein